MHWNGATAGSQKRSNPAHPKPSPARLSPSHHRSPECELGGGKEPIPPPFPNRKGAEFVIGIVKFHEGRVLASPPWGIA